MYKCMWRDKRFPPKTNVKAALDATWPLLKKAKVQRTWEKVEEVVKVDKVDVIDKVDVVDKVDNHKHLLLVAHGLRELLVMLCVAPEDPENIHYFIITIQKILKCIIILII